MKAGSILGSAPRAFALGVATSTLYPTPSNVSKGSNQLFTPITLRQHDQNFAHRLLSVRRGLLTKYQFDGKNAKIIRGSATAALEGKPEGEAAIRR